MGFDKDLRGAFSTLKFYRQECKPTFSDIPSILILGVVLLTENMFVENGKNRDLSRPLFGFPFFHSLISFLDGDGNIN